MANGECCRKCGFQESTHNCEPELTCGSFISEVKHKKDCPVIECNGNCEEAIAQARKISEEEIRASERRFPH